mmetsp:Transcript_80175/g.180886  ORF Transcript_80175/g.180886 Transcript_80175/m.180886 type:complete len:335 (+) Transcript_80175:79-1083(+)|eukprot:CAMPEP_0197890366 /NCGR_PEP_ID=MMETSP1439-20131203/26389_1 /TAXON_ID=66791 /ORGANISM="Gonyaulax spinifera, Strain CCMP409" /LENGTH=334 /DNA_ID=CAMNT_0043510393 /DNA_START=70 /DNA_END=1074 /DNA_ORIENTATION=-
MIKAILLVAALLVIQGFHVSANGDAEEPELESPPKDSLFDMNRMREEERDVVKARLVKLSDEQLIAEGMNMNLPDEDVKYDLRTLEAKYGEAYDSARMSFMPKNPADLRQAATRIEGVDRFWAKTARLVDLEDKMLEDDSSKENKYAYKLWRASLTEMIMEAVESAEIKVIKDRLKDRLPADITELRNMALMIKGYDMDDIMPKSAEELREMILQDLRVEVKKMASGTGMTQDMQQGIEDIALQSFKAVAQQAFDSAYEDNSAREADLAGKMKKGLDKKYSKAWHVIVGPSFGARVSTSSAVWHYFQLLDETGEKALYFFVWKTTSRTKAQDEY